MSEARLYTAEVRIKEMEDKTFNNFAQSKEIFKKLIYALEQENLSNQDFPASKSYQKPNYDFLESLKAEKTDDKNATIVHKNTDFLFVKRLFYIKQDIDELFEEQEDINLEDYKTTKAPPSLLQQKDKASRKSSEIFFKKPRVQTVAHSVRKKRLSTMSPVNLYSLKGKTKISMR